MPHYQLQRFSDTMALELEATKLRDFERRIDDAEQSKTLFNPIWTGLFANLKRLGGPKCPPPPPPF